MAKALERAGLSAVALLDAYEFMNRNHYPQDDMARLRRFDVMVHLLESAGGQSPQVQRSTGSIVSVEVSDLCLVF